MLEIIGMIAFARLLARAAVAKGRSKGWAALGVLFWLGGELMGFLVGSFLGLESLLLYGLALLMAATGVLVSYLVVKALPPMEVPEVGPSTPVAG